MSCLVPGGCGTMSLQRAHRLRVRVSRPVAIRRLRVYVAGPLGTPSALGPERVTENVRRAMAVGRQLVTLGYAPLVPHTTAWWPSAWDEPWESWLQVAEAWVTVSGAVLRISGESPGADREVVLAERLGIPVFHTVQDLAAAFPSLPVHGGVPA